jgi:hypothetical protein
LREVPAKTGYELFQGGSRQKTPTPEGNSRKNCLSISNERH